MFSLPSFKTYLYIIGILSFIVAEVYFVWSWHYIPISILEKEVITLKEDVQDKDLVINNLSTQVIQLTEGNIVSGFENYFKGYEDANNTTIDNTKLIF